MSTAAPPIAAAAGTSLSTPLIFCLANSPMADWAAALLIASQYLLRHFRRRRVPPDFWPISVRWIVGSEVASFWSFSEAWLIETFPSEMSRSSMMTLRGCWPGAAGGAFLSAGAGCAGVVRHGGRVLLRIALDGLQIAAAVVIELISYLRLFNQDFADDDWPLLELIDAVSIVMA